MEGHDVCSFLSRASKKKSSVCVCVCVCVCVIEHMGESVDNGSIWVRNTYGFSVLFTKLSIISDMTSK